VRAATTACVHAEHLVERDAYRLRGVAPARHLLGVHPEPGGGPRVPGGHLGGVAEVQLRHEVGVDVVVDDRGVLVGTGHAVDAELAGRVVVPQRAPQPRGGDEQLEPDLALEVGVAGDQDVPADGVGDVGVDVERGRPRRPVAGALLAADRPPGERGAAQAQLLGPLVGQRQDRLAPAQGVRRGVGLEVAQHRQAERLGVPERVAVVARPGQALGPDRPALRPRARLQHVEDRDAHGLLQLGVAVDLDVCGGPEPVEE
jgi:hypothetical protein